MTFLGQVSTGRDNNFNLLRMIAASAVLVSHAYPIVLGPGAAEPLKGMVGHSLGCLAVFLFFALSGFLITASFDRSRSVERFLMARALRLMPCLVVSILLVALVMGQLVTALPLGAYLTHPGTGTFILRNIALFEPQYTLRGVFETNPYPMVEGSIWTLTNEVACYVMVLVAGVFGILHRPRLRAAALGAYMAFWAVKLGTGLTLHGRIEQFLELSFPFVLGMAFYLWRDRIPMSLLLRAGDRGAGGGAEGHGAVHAGAGVVVGVGLCHLLGWLRPARADAGLQPARRLLYGIYIYAFPIQVLVVWRWGPLSPLGNILLALPLTRAISVLSCGIWLRPPHWRSGQTRGPRRGGG